MGPNGPVLQLIQPATRAVHQPKNRPPQQILPKPMAGIMTQMVPNVIMGQQSSGVQLILKAQSAQTLTTSSTPKTQVVSGVNSNSTANTVYVQAARQQAQPQMMRLVTGQSLQLQPVQTSAGVALVAVPTVQSAFQQNAGQAVIPIQTSVINQNVIKKTTNHITVNNNDINGSNTFTIKKKRKKEEETTRLDLANLIKLSGIDEEDIVSPTSSVSSFLSCSSPSPLSSSSSSSSSPPLLTTCSTHTQTQTTTPKAVQTDPPPAQVFIQTPSPQSQHKQDTMSLLNQLQATIASQQGLRLVLGEDGQMILQQTQVESQGVASTSTQSQLAQLLAEHGGHILQNALLNLAGTDTVLMKNQSVETPSVVVQPRVADSPNLIIGSSTDRENTSSQRILGGGGGGGLRILTDVGSINGLGQVQVLSNNTTNNDRIQIVTNNGTPVTLTEQQKLQLLSSLTNNNNSNNNNNGDQSIGRVQILSSIPTSVSISSTTTASSASTQERNSSVEIITDVPTSSQKSSQTDNDDEDKYEYGNIREQQDNRIRNNNNHNNNNNKNEEIIMEQTKYTQTNNTDELGPTNVKLQLSINSINPKTVYTSLNQNNGVHIVSINNENKIIDNQLQQQKQRINQQQKQQRIDTEQQTRQNRSINTINIDVYQQQQQQKQQQQCEQQSPYQNKQEELNNKRDNNQYDQRSGSSNYEDGDYQRHDRCNIRTTGLNVESFQVELKRNQTDQIFHHHHHHLQDNKDDQINIVNNRITLNCNTNVIDNEIITSNVFAGQQLDNVVINTRCNISTNQQNNRQFNNNRNNNRNNNNNDNIDTRQSNEQNVCSTSQGGQNNNNWTSPPPPQPAPMAPKSPPPNENSTTTFIDDNNSFINNHDYKLDLRKGGNHNNKKVKKSAVVKPMVFQAEDKKSPPSCLTPLSSNDKQMGNRVQTIQLTPQKQQHLKSVQDQISALSGKKVRTPNEQSLLQRLFNEQQKILMSGKIVQTVKGLDVQGLTFVSTPVRLVTPPSSGSPQDSSLLSGYTKISSQPEIIEVQPSVVEPKKIILSKSERTDYISKQMEADEKAAMQPDIKSCFSSVTDACKRLLRYHCMNEPVLSEKDLEKADEIFESTAKHLLDKKAQLFNKHQVLLMKESMKQVQTSELIMLGRLYVQDESSSLEHLKQQVASGSTNPVTTCTQATQVELLPCKRELECETDLFDKGREVKKHCADDEEINAQVQSAIDSILNLRGSDAVTDEAVRSIFQS